MVARHLRERGLPVSRATVGRVLADADVRPHKVRGWLNRADDPSFWARAGAVCRLYLDPPPGTVLVSIDEKTGIQAKTRTHPDIPACPGRDARREFEYARHGTVSIVAAMNVATGEVIGQRIARNDSVTFIGFLSMLDQCTAPGLRIHLIMDNGSSHTSKATRPWIAAHHRFTVTYTPRHASWLNIIEQWFSILTRKLLRRGDFTSRDDLETRITDFTHRLQQHRASPEMEVRRGRRARPLPRTPPPQGRPRPSRMNATERNRRPVKDLRAAALVTAVTLG
jgi:transposase